MRVDVLIVGSGAGGGTLARALAPAGLSILVLERGGYLAREKENWEPRAVFREQRYHTREHWLDESGKPFRPGAAYVVGGNTKVYGAATLRRRVSDFGAVRHIDGETQRWPIAYEDLAPFYRTAEQWYFVHGLRGEDPTEPPEEHPYPFPPVSHEPRIAEVFTRLRRLGLRPFHLPLAVRLDESQRDSSPCIRCNTCDGFPCLVNAKGDAEWSGIRPAQAAGSIGVRTAARVRRVLTDATGRRAIGVELETEEGSETIEARVVVLSAGAVNSASLLLASRTERQTNGLANGSGLVGRNYMCHNNSAVLAISPSERNPTVFQKTIGVNDFYLDSGDPDFPYPLGHIQLLGKATGGVLEAQRPRVPAPVLRWMAAHSVDWWITTEDLARPENRVSLDGDGGIRLSYTPTNLAEHERLARKLKELLGKIGFPIVLFQKMGIEAVAHQCGTARFGVDPAYSVLDPYCRAHEMENLYVVDGSFMPSASAVNPSLTIMAQAIRVAEHLKDRFRAGSIAS
ncbi:MAG TPA: GMC family oxidoreductase [Candidatus Dormibacteraeota bacterium]|nr:GMC family oxidoreductase [Candidatus Dormibacteraeota bacterium]